jgi:hypothetical protein
MITILGLCMNRRFLMLRLKSELAAPLQFQHTIFIWGIKEILVGVIMRRTHLTEFLVYRLH